jgi:hypothetical protein
VRIAITAGMFNVTHPAVNSLSAEDNIADTGKVTTEKQTTHFSAEEYSYAQSIIDQAITFGENFLKNQGGFDPYDSEEKIQAQEAVEAFKQKKKEPAFLAGISFLRQNNADVFNIIINLPVNEINIAHLQTIINRLPEEIRGKFKLTKREFSDSYKQNFY